MNWRWRQSLSGRRFRWLNHKCLITAPSAPWCLFFGKRTFKTFCLYFSCWGTKSLLGQTFTTFGRPRILLLVVKNQKLPKKVRMKNEKYWRISQKESFFKMTLSIQTATFLFCFSSRYYDFVFVVGERYISSFLILQTFVFLFYF